MAASGVGGGLVRRPRESQSRVGAGGHGANDEIVESEVDDSPDLVGRAVTARGQLRVDADQLRESAAALGGHRADALGGRRQQVRVRHEGREIGLGEVAVVVGLLLGAQRVGAPVRLVPVPGLLYDSLS